MSDGKVMAVDRKRFKKLGGADSGLQNWGAAGLGKQYFIGSYNIYALKIWYQHNYELLPFET